MQNDLFVILRYIYRSISTSRDCVRSRGRVVKAMDWGLPAQVRILPTTLSISIFFPSFQRIEVFFSRLELPTMIYTVFFFIKKYIYIYIYISFYN